MDFLHKMTHIQLNNAFLVLWSIPAENKKFWWGKKLTTSERICYSEFFFSSSLKRENPEKMYWFNGDTFFGQTNEMGQVLPKIVFHLKMRYIQLNYAFLVFWSVYVKIYKKLQIKVKKVIYTESFSYFEMGHILKKSIDLMGTFFQWNGTNITENSFPPQKEPHTAKLSCSGVLKHFFCK